MKITINNWHEYQLRKDVKVSSWFRFEHNFFTDHKFFTLDNDEKIIWINILCTASIESKDEFEYNLDLVSRLTNVKVHKINKTLEKLQSFQCIKLQTRTRNEHDTHTCLQTDRQTDKQTDKKDFDVDIIYAVYPRKEGKKSGYDKLKKLISSQEEYDLILNGAKRYAEYCKKSETPKKYIKQFSTWVNNECWNDEYEVEKTFDDIMQEIIDDSDAKFAEMEKMDNENKQGLL